MPGPELTVTPDHSKVDEGIVTVRLAGEIDSSTAPNLLGELQALIFTGAPRELVLDFRKVDFMDSAGIRVIIDIQKQLRESGALLVLEDVSPTTRQVLEITGLTNQLEMR